MQFPALGAVSESLRLHVRTKQDALATVLFSHGCGIWFQCFPFNFGRMKWYIKRYLGLQFSFRFQFLFVSPPFTTIIPFILLQQVLCSIIEQLYFSFLPFIMLSSMSAFHSCISCPLKSVSTLSSGVSVKVFIYSFNQSFYLPIYVSFL